MLSVSVCRKPQRAREGRSPLEVPVVPSGVYGGHGAIFAAENLIFQSKNRFPAVFALENLKDFSKNWWGWQWRGSVLPRPPSLSKSFLTSYVQCGRSCRQQASNAARKQSSSASVVRWLRLTRQDESAFRRSPHSASTAAEGAPSVAQADLTDTHTPISSSIC